MFFSKFSKYSKSFLKVSKKKARRSQGVLVSKSFRNFGSSYSYVFQKKSVVTREQMIFVRNYVRVCFKQSRFVFCVFPNFVRTSKGLGSRIGKGKGGVANYVVPVEPGTIFFQVSGISSKQAVFLGAQLSKLLGQVLTRGKLAHFIVKRPRVSRYFYLSVLFYLIAKFFVNKVRFFCFHV